MSERTNPPIGMLRNEPGRAASPVDRRRVVASRIIGVISIALYNWWIVVVFDRHLLTSPNAFFSDLEATGRADAALLSHVDLAAGLLLVVALMLRGPRSKGLVRPEWSLLVAYAFAGAIGGQVPYACSEGLSHACRVAEWHLRLPLHHYVHVVAGIFEFAFATSAIYLAWRRTRASTGRSNQLLSWLGVALIVGYPLLGVAYLTNRFGAVVEPIFFICFSAIAAFELFETA